MFFFLLPVPDACAIHRSIKPRWCSRSKADQYRMYSSTAKNWCEKSLSFLTATRLFVETKWTISDYCSTQLCTYWWMCRDNSKRVDKLLFKLGMLLFLRSNPKNNFSFYLCRAWEMKYFLGCHICAIQCHTSTIVCTSKWRRRCQWNFLK